MTDVVTIGDRRVGSGQPVMIIAEAGVNHDGDVKVAHQLVDVAAASGAEVVKFQAFDPEAVAGERAALAPYQADETQAPSQRELLKDLTLPASAWTELQAHANDAGLLFLCTPFDRRSLDMLVSLGVAALKVPSGEIDNVSFLRAVAAVGVPVILSTGASTLDEVRVAVEMLAPVPTVILHCVTAYPAPLAAANLRSIRTLVDEFGVPVGFSDHTLGPTAALAAVALGACVLEKHLTLDRSRSGPDHAASADPTQFAEYVGLVRDVEGALGDGTKQPQPVELPNLPLIRRSAHAARDLNPGDRLTENDVEWLRPTGGLPPSVPVAGRLVRRPVPTGSPIVDDDLEEAR